MQLTVETVAFVAFQRVREIEVEPVLSDLMAYYERDEARHIGLGVQLVPQMVSKLSIHGAMSLAVFQLDLLMSTLFSLKTIERDLIAIGVDPRSMLGMAFRKQADIDTKIRGRVLAVARRTPPLRRVFEGVCEALFPSEGADANVPTGVRMKHALEVVARKRQSVFEQWGLKRPTALFVVVVGPVSTFAVLAVREVRLRAANAEPNPINLDEKGSSRRLRGRRTLSRRDGDRSDPGACRLQSASPGSAMPSRAQGDAARAKRDALAPRATQLVLSAIRLVLRATQLALSAMRLVLRATQLVPSAMRLVLRATQLVLSAMRLVLRATQLVLGAMRLVLRAPRRVRCEGD